MRGTPKHNKITILVILFFAFLLGILGYVVFGENGSKKTTQKTNITIIYTPDARHPVTASLSCEPERATSFLSLTGAARVCKIVEELGPGLGQKKEAGQVCAQIFAGPEHVSIIGTINGKPVDARFSRDNACAEAEWNNSIIVHFTPFFLPSAYHKKPLCLKYYSCSATNAKPKPPLLTK